MSETELPIWTVYDHPRDFPNVFVARLWMNDKPTGEIMLSRDLEKLRDMLQAKGLVKLMRHETDDPVIVETWL